jgi:hypothetical protein
MKVSIKYEVSTMGKDEDNLLMEKKTVLNRKIPKNASLVIKLNYFDSYDSLVNLQNQNGKYYFEIDLFGEDKKLRKVIYYLPSHSLKNLVLKETIFITSLLKNTWYMILSLIQIFLNI